MKELQVLKVLWWKLWQSCEKRLGIGNRWQPEQNLQNFQSWSFAIITEQEWLGDKFCVVEGIQPTCSNTQFCVSFFFFLVRFVACISRTYWLQDTHKVKQVSLFTASLRYTAEGTLAPSHAHEWKNHSLAVIRSTVIDVLIGRPL